MKYILVKQIKLWLIYLFHCPRIWIYKEEHTVLSIKVTPRQRKSVCEEMGACLQQVWPSFSSFLYKKKHFSAANTSHFKSGKKKSWKTQMFESFFFSWAPLISYKIFWQNWVLVIRTQEKYVAMWCDHRLATVESKISKRES